MRSMSAAVTSRSIHLNHSGCCLTMSLRTSKICPIAIPVPRPLGLPLFAPGEPGA